MGLTYRGVVLMLNEKEAFESSINGLTACLQQHTKNCICFTEAEIEKKIHEIETLNANLDANFLTLQNISELNNVKPHETLNFYRKLVDTRSNVNSALTQLKDSNDLIKFLKIDIQVNSLKKIQTELLQADELSTKEKVVIWCGALERAEKENKENPELKEILYKEIILVKKRFMNKAERLASYEHQAELLLKNNKNFKI